MTIEQRIINVAEKQNYYDSRQLRAIAMDVRKMEDRIKQLEESENRMLNWLTEDCPESVKKQLSNAWMKSKAKP